jgi:RNA polymerase sigma-70 factor, ECF subfamily
MSKPRNAREGLLPQLEQRLAALLDAGELVDAATAAIRGYGPQLFGYLNAVLRNPEDGQEAFAQLSEELWREIGRFRRECSFRTWAYTLAWHVALKVARDPYRRRRRTFSTGAAAELAAEVRSKTAPHLQTAVKDRMAELRRSLAPDEQTLLILKLDRGLSWREIAHVLADPDDPLDEAALRKRFERLKEKLRKLAIAERLIDGND